MMVPWILPLVETIIRRRNPPFAPRISPTYQFWEGQVIPERQGRRSWPRPGHCRLSLPQTRPSKVAGDPMP